MGIELLILFVLIVLNAFFAASEIALISLNDNKVKLDAEKGDKKAILLHSLLAEPSRFLATIQIGITLAGFLASAFAAESFAGRFTEFLLNMGVPVSAAVLETISVVVITLILSYFTLVLGELVPKRLALQKAEGISRFAVVPLSVLSKISSPFVKLLTFSTNMIVRLFGVDPNAEDENVTEEEIRMMVDVGKEKGTIQENEKIMINNIFELDNKDVGDIMTHRTNIVAIPYDLNLKEAAHIVNVEKYTRFPVFEESLDQIIGILHVKDLIQFLENGGEETFNLKTLVRNPYYVLESKSIDSLFAEMQKNNTHMAIVIDEYGGTDGIVTIEDIMEEIVGSISDEYDEPELEEDEIIQLDDQTYMIMGSTNLYEVEEVLKADLPIEEFDTLNGFVLGQLGFIPNESERPVVNFKNVEFSVEEMDDKRIAKIKALVKDEIVIDTNV
ncbi:HlyC/CorC family transporter [Rossellomorea vietnamensis]|uniref:HlyC/CorC family transporter n=1 Tax=Rossellomorea vietnamensis TaxID=218284 RepID=A0A5D4KLB1_9BACI|nr:hemolysin family protein [Rossellomorea vietnamensis]TYR77093.1 HlyC/CorC family transporter [Rossellomorea vietnamensis]